MSGFSVGRQHRNYFMFCGRFRYDKDAEVSACTERMPDTCAFVPTPHKVIPMQGENPEKPQHQEMTLRSSIEKAEAISRFRFFVLT